MFTGTIVNVITVLIGSTTGLLIGKYIPRRVGDTVMQGLGLITVYIGITGMLDGENALITILSIVLGAIIGEVCDLDGLLNRFSSMLENRFNRGRKGEGAKVSIAEGFISASLLFCVGAMTIMGALQDGLQGDHTLLFTKATMDLVSSLVFASTLGLGVLLAAGSVLVIEGGIALLAGLLAPVLNYGNTVTEMTVVGSVLILGLGLNILGITKLKMMNYVPAIFLPILFCRFM